MLRKRLKHFFPANAAKQSRGEGEVSYMLPPKLRNGMLMRGPNGNSIYLMENGTLREFQSWNAFVRRGYDLENVKSFPPFEYAGVPFGPGLK